MIDSNRFARIALAIIYVWFGVLKIFRVSPASPLVDALFGTMTSFVSTHTFGIAFGIFEVVIGVLFLCRRYTTFTIILFALHMVTCFLPLILLPNLTWTLPFVPTMDGQYIIKNLALIALAIVIAKDAEKKSHSSIR